MTTKVISFSLNGRPIEVMVKPLMTLQTLLRQHLGYTATKAGCKQGACGSCTVIVNGEPMLACLLPVEDVAGQEVITLEGISVNGQLHPLQEVFFEKYAIQCGYCTPGMIMVSKALLDHNPQPSRDEVIEAITGNFCRCTGYEPIIQAVLETSKRLNGK